LQASDTVIWKRERALKKFEQKFTAKQAFTLVKF